MTGYWDTIGGIWLLGIIISVILLVVMALSLLYKSMVNFSKYSYKKIDNIQRGIINNSYRGMYLIPWVGMLIYGLTKWEEGYIEITETLIYQGIPLGISTTFIIAMIEITEPYWRNEPDES